MYNASAKLGIVIIKPMVICVALIPQQYRRSTITYCYFTANIPTVYMAPIVLSEKTCFITGVLIGEYLPTVLILVIQVSLQTSLYTGPEGEINDIRQCNYWAPKKSLPWIFNVLGNVVTYLRENRRPSPTSGLKGLINMLLGQGLLYFVLIIAYEVLSTVGNIPQLLISDSVNNNLIELNIILNVALPCILGPWLILSIRRNHMAHMTGGTSITAGTRDRDVNKHCAFSGTNQHSLLKAISGSTPA
ncbi:hypothetical protein CONPUDRAFT_76055 [Coniophora puteana RWD-64-598 SS2]|uniref:Uncharacterized protein n=1 Tax=Coniophora puteana (strain RWD-64-598) TaxID=741705 RepID=A0A5M3MER8_CONPW|nr:uncharacterized protein CONPUDRAFT_76055 [Coniophora puteana RWD-64-598 SS2]EIW77294.1 hypothetical protein CONPUDRAFT_76055 [Coniophora puteana RWD-64-598 SS2]